MSVETYIDNRTDADARVVLELDLADAEALHTWLLKASADGVPSLDEPRVSAALAALSRTLDDVHIVESIRRELSDVGISGGHLSHEQVRELGQRISLAVSTASA